MVLTPQKMLCYTWIWGADLTNRTPQPELEVPYLRLFHFNTEKRKDKFTKDEKT